MQVEVWSDIVCPWCYIGNVRLQKAIASLDDPESVSVTTRSFELDPTISGPPRANLERLAEKFGVSVEQAREMEGRIAALAEEEGVPFEFERVSGNSFDLHRLVHLARESGQGEQLFERLQSAFFGRGENVFDHAVLAREATELGLSEARVSEVLASDDYSEAVRRDESEARQIGVGGVPFAVLERKWAIPGAVATEQYAKALKEISSESPKT